MDNRTPKEVVYDDQIAPRLSEIVDLCVKHGISMVARFDISNKEEPTLVVSTQLPDGQGEYSKLLASMSGFISGDPGRLDRENPGYIGEEAEELLKERKL